MIKIFGLLSCSLLLTFYLNAQDVESIKRLNNSFKRVIYSDFKAAKSIALQSVFESEQTQNDTLLLDAYTNLSQLYLYLKKIDSSSFYCDKALVYANRTKIAKKKSILYNRKGILARIKNNFKGSLEFHKNALDIAISHNYVNLEVDIKNSLALLYRSKLDEKNFFSYLESAINLAKRQGYKKGLAEAYNTKGLLLFDTQKDSVLYYYNKAIEIVNVSNDMFLKGIVLSNIGDYYLNIENNEKAIFYLNEAEHVSKEVGDKATQYYTTMSQGIYNDNFGDFSAAEKKYKNALSDFKAILDGSKKARVYWLLSGVLWNNKKYKEAFIFQEKYIYLNDSIFNLEKEKEFETLRTQFEVEKKDNQIALLEKENELATIRRQRIVIGAVLLLLPLIGLFLFYKQRAKTQRTIRKQELKLHQQEKAHLQQEQQLKATQALIEGQDKERERIAKELHDGIAGQLASINLSLSHVNVEEDKTAIVEINKSLKQTFKELRDLSHDLSYNYHQDKAFTHLLAELKEKYEQSKQFSLEISIFPEDALQDIDVYTKHNLYRIVQELLTNIAKHAKAKEVQLSFNRHDALLIMVLEDNGVGFNVEAQKEGVGIKNIKQRVDSIKGTFNLESTLGKGSSVIIEIPLKSIIET